MSSNDKPESKIGSMASAMGGSTADRRRSSASAGSKFSSLDHQKRGSIDAGTQARKASWAEQTKPPGFIGGLWQTFTKGNNK